MVDSINNIDVLRNKYNNPDLSIQDKYLDIGMCTKLLEVVS